MTFVPERSQLRGLSVQVAELYGKPHIGAHYEGKGVKTHKRNDGALCPICFSHAQSVHHVPPLSKGREFLLETPRGSWPLKPSLFALCGSGTTGCHNGFHGGARFEPHWVWRDDDCARAWWSGEILEAYQPHDKGLYLFGYWSIQDRRDGGRIEVGR